jgi:group I intron endonuclease
MIREATENRLYGIVYEIKCIPTGKIYIGVTTVGLEERWKGHLYELKKNKDNNCFHNAIRKYSKENFSKRIIDVAYSKEELDFMEKIWILFKNARNRNFGYNSAVGGGSGPLSEEHKQKISDNHADMSGKNNPMFGTTRIHSKETKQKMKENSPFKNKIGEDSPNNKLSWNDVIDIRLQSYLDASVEYLSKRYKTSISNIYRIINNERWYKE